ncbi:MAG: nitrous oxide reductase family maturation protein NosD [Chromatiaceae bacterium]|nr:nitrous oxide reductase family maturation protein NosD [Gammaproteobacteria bacterium]MCP5312181.1 nitrous oxide reductase family maturation protein NosD [Chromatiaceae bacterium]
MHVRLARPWAAIPIAWLILTTVASAELPSFQALIDAAEPNSLLSPPAGTYAGPVIVDKPLDIDGRGEVTIDAGGKGSVVVLDTDGATLRNLHLINSGDSHNDLDAGVQVRGNFNVVKDNRIEDCLFGVDMQQSENNIVRRNHITSKPVELGIRGDAIRLWYSFSNRVEDNTVVDSRDIVVWYSRDNVIRRNSARGGRYSLHFMYSQYNLVEDNDFRGNSVGIFLMYSDSVVVRRNHISHAVGAAGVGIGFKETSDVDIVDNEILYCATGLHLDVSPFQPDTSNRIHGNLLAYNGIGIQFLNDWTGNVFEDNLLKGNLTPVAVLGGKTAARNDWNGNHWDDYAGFDRDRDGIGDTPYEQYAYADRIWMDVPPARFFKGTPMLEVLDFLERLAPFTSPDLLLRDNKPLMAAEFRLDKSPTTPVAPTRSPNGDDASGQSTDAQPAEPDAYQLLLKSLGRQD